MVALVEKPAFSSFEKVLTCLEEWASYGHTSYWQAWEKLKLLSPSLSRISPFFRAGTFVTREKTRLHMASWTKFVKSSCRHNRGDQRACR